MTTFNDILKAGFLENMNSFSLLNAIIALFLAFIISLCIILVYKYTFNGVLYDSSFNITLMGLCMITTFVILAITSNIVLSLGMVGALSIVRFRTTIKNPLDTIYLFWSIAVGIVLGAGMFSLAIIGSAILSIILLMFSNNKETSTAYILVLTCDNYEAETNSLTLLNKYINKYKIKSKTVNNNGIELTIEIKLKENNYNLINLISAVNGVNNVVLVNYNGDLL